MIGSSTSPSKRLPELLSTIAELKWQAVRGRGLSPLAAPRLHSSAAPAEAARLGFRRRES
jgi:hypothetical protein